MSSSSRIFLEMPDGHAIEVKNWQSRRGQKDTIFGKLLPPGGYEELKRRRDDAASDDASSADASGAADAERRAGQPSSSSFVVEEGLPVTVLGKAQLTALAARLLGQEMSSLERMAYDDLIKLVRRVAKMKRVKIRIGPEER
jgi:hypothetical protein